MQATFKHIELNLLNPSFDSPLVDINTELEILRNLQIETKVPTYLFEQLKYIFHLCESIGSARIEGNHTTLSDYVENKIERPKENSEMIQEIQNIEYAMAFIDQEMTKNKNITDFFIRELHSLVVKDLQQEGDNNPGQYRQNNVTISQSIHIPPNFLHVSNYMSELINFINSEDKPKYDLIKIALTHHRFCWIHPFLNGNGRTVRLLTYALLIKYGFNVQDRILNPTAVFCSDRDKYYTMLSKADIGDNENLEEWCNYVLTGISNEIKKIDKLANLNFLNLKILFPAITLASNKNIINDIEAKILKKTIELGEIKVSSLSNINLKPAQITYQLKKLIKQELIKPISSTSRTYIINIENSSLLRCIIQLLDQEGLIPFGLNK